MNVVPIAKEWIDIYPVMVNRNDAWVMGLSDCRCDGDEHIYQELYPTRDAAVLAARAWDMPTIFHRP